MSEKIDDNKPNQHFVKMKANVLHTSSLLFHHLIILVIYSNSKLDKAECFVDLSIACVYMYNEGRCGLSRSRPISRCG